jgi:hypothetical protein
LAGYRSVAKLKNLVENFFECRSSLGMQVFDKVVNQVRSVGLPVVAVSLTAIPRANTPVLLMVHWHGFAKPQAPRLGQPGAPVETPVSVPGSALQLSDTWIAMEHLDDAMLQAAWQFGAWDLVREERRGCNTAGASDREVMECRQAFAENPFDGLCEDMMVAEAPDRGDLMNLGARFGYVHWQFRPVKNGLWRDSAGDETLQPDGGRKPPCPIVPRPVVGTRLSRTRYHLGHSSHIVLL